MKPQLNNIEFHDDFEVRHKNADIAISLHDEDPDWDDILTITVPVREIISSDVHKKEYDPEQARWEDCDLTKEDRVKIMQLVEDTLVNEGYDRAD